MSPAAVRHAYAAARVRSGVALAALVVALPTLRARVRQWCVAATPRPPLRVLLVEDDAMLGAVMPRAIEAAFAGAGHAATVTLARTVTGALAELDAAGDFDAAVVDINLGDATRTGLDVAAACGRLTRVVLLSGELPAGDLADAAARLGALVRTKPVAAPDLVADIVRELDA